MRFSKYFKVVVLLAVGGIGINGCTKLDETYVSTIPADQAAQALGPGGVALVLNAAYADLKDPFISDQGKVFSLMEIQPMNRSLPPAVVTDDNGDRRAIHAQSWNANHSAILVPQCSE